MTRNEGIRCSIRAAVIVLVAGLLLSAEIPVSHSQTFYGSIVGTVTDSTGAIVPGAAVTVTSIATNERRTTQSNSAGDYSVVSLVPATYTVEVQKASFKRVLRNGVTVQVNTTVRVDAVLQVGAVSETVEVTTQAPLLQTDSGTLGAVVEGKTVQEMPLNGRNTMNLLALTAGVVPSNNAMNGTTLNSGGHTASSSWSAYSIGGGLSGQSAMYVDGAPLNVLGGAGGGNIGYVPTQDSVQEFNVTTSASSAEYGRYSGGVVNMTTKSGANALHASAYEYLRNNVLNANEFFNKQTELANAKPNKRTQWNQNQYGVVVSGPIKKDKIFYMGSWEAFTARTASNNAGNVPTTDMQNGLITSSSAANATALVNAVTALKGASCVTAVDSTHTQVNISNSACLDSAAKVMKTFWPAPYSGVGANNFNKPGSTGTDTGTYTGRIDYTISDKQRFFGRYTANNIKDTAQEAIPGGVDPSGKAWHIGGGATVIRSQSAVLGDTYTFNPATILDIRLSYLRTYNSQAPPTAGMDMSIFGSNWGTLGKSMTITNIPTLNFGNDVSVSGFRGSNQLSYQWNDNEGVVASLMKIIGKHSLKIGLEGRFMDRASLNESGNNSNGGGTFAFSTNYFTNNSWVNFLLGLTDSATFNTVREVGSYNWYQGYYVNDSWQATRKLTITGGLRWELPGNAKEKKDRAIELMPTLTDSATGAYGTAVLVNSSLYPDRGTLPARHNLFAPNLGFAYRFTSSDVIRGGYGYNLAPPDIQSGMFPDQVSMNVYTDSWNRNTGENFLLSNPLPNSDSRWTNGIRQPLGRSGFSTTPFLKNSLTAPGATSKFPYTQQWNLSVSHQFQADLMIEIGYAGSLATHLPLASANTPVAMNQIGSQTWADQSLPYSTNTSVTTTLTSAQLTACKSIWTTGTTYGQCARPHSAYTTYSDVIGNAGSINYHSMPVRIQKRFRSGGLVSGTYTWSKAIGNIGGGIQDWNNLSAERSITPTDMRQRLVVSYVLNLPFGKGAKFLSGVSNGAVQRLISGWAVNGITTYQTGFPLSISANEPNSHISIPVTYGAGTLRPNVVAGCKKMADGSRISHVLAGTSVLNASCWNVTPDTYTAPLGPGGTTRYYATTLGNQPRVDPEIKAPGYANWDFSAMKKTAITEKVNLEFRMEFFNIFNHPRFGAQGAQINPSGMNAGTPFGVINSNSQGANQPRLGQASLRMSF